MLTLAFDTETTGLWNKYSPPTHPSQPRLVQLAAVLVDGPRNVGGLLAIVRPDDFVIPERATAVHGITQERALAVGIPLESVMATFASMVHLATTLVGHNLEYDLNIARRELSGLGLAAVFDGKEQFCTMKASTDVCRIPKPNGWSGYKWPSLFEVYRLAFGEDLVDAHDAMNDLRATLRVWRWLNDGAVLFADRKAETI